MFAANPVSSDDALIFYDGRDDLMKNSKTMFGRRGSWGFKNSKTMFGRSGSWGFIDNPLHDEVFLLVSSTSTLTWRSSFRWGWGMESRAGNFFTFEVALLWTDGRIVHNYPAVLDFLCFQHRVQVVHKVRGPFFGLRSSLGLEVDDCSVHGHSKTQIEVFSSSRIAAGVQLGDFVSVDLRSSCL